MNIPAFIQAHEIATHVSEKTLSAKEIVNHYLERIETLNPSLNAYSSILSQRAKQRAAEIDQDISRGINPGPLAGVPFAVKNLFDIAGEITLAGSKINANNPPAKVDAKLIQQLEKAGAILLGGLSMGEYAYDFTGENAHYGNCANPWSLSSMSGGSSSGSGSATAAAIAPLSLGSDTNGSIRVPASLCGIFGLKPTYGRLSRTGTYPFSDSLDHLGPLARSVKDLALCFDALQGYDSKDHACIKRENINTINLLDRGIDGMRIKRAVGYFSCRDFPQAQAAMDKVCQILHVNEEIELPGTHEGRSAAYLITNVEGSALHKAHLQTQADNFDADTRYRFIAGALLPAQWYIKAQQVRLWYRNQVLPLFKDTDIIIAPATPCTAPKMGEKTLTIAGEKQALRPNLGYFTQPFSAIGLPSLVIPTLDKEANMPIGIQVIAAPWREDLCFQVASYLEREGCISHQPSLS
ncbi:AtzE family amidohydrolase [Agarilytica rhodophyticola]|uniref:AtzE family amidohydrolase n=1 Tax=Agarilytica rhodophyticola TaxID=1737490 RepID=UPI001FECA502|nr:AtzE family amidohydrolase [Agarilytica rhodophyticola]